MYSYPCYQGFSNAGSVVLPLDIRDGQENGSERGHEAVRPISAGKKTCFPSHMQLVNSHNYLVSK